MDDDSGTHDGSLFGVRISSIKKDRYLAVAPSCPIGSSQREQELMKRMLMANIAVSVSCHQPTWKAAELHALTGKKHFR